MSSQSFSVLLVSIDELDSFSLRDFTLPVGSTFPIGRASSNTQKRHLMSAQDNGYIDSPVISREHAVLSANCDSGKPRVYITDRNSMHGTMVNDEKLEPMAPKLISSGDLLQFGADVNRNDSSFLARKYVIEATLRAVEPQTQSESFSRGFTVPDAESSEDEGVDEATFVSAPPPSTRYGSQNNPVTIDDTEEPTHDVIEIDEDPDEVVEVPPPAKPDVTVHRSPSPPAAQLSPSSSQLSAYGDSDSDMGVPASMDAMSFSAYSSDDDGEEEEDEDDEDSDANSDSGSEPSSEPEFTSEVDPAEADEEDATADLDASADLDAVRRMKLEAMLNHERDNATEEEPKPAATSSLSVPPPDHTPMMSSPTVQANSQQQSLQFYPHQDIPPLAILESPYVNMFGTVPSMPPQSRPVWGDDFPAAHVRESAWWPEESSGPTNYMGTNFGDRPVLFSPAPLPSVVDPMQPKPLTQNWAPTTPPCEDEADSQPSEASRSSVPAAPETQSPPSMSSDPVTSNPPQRRTKVTIPEIVEDHPSPPNPPTPTSVTNRKRKADVLDDEEVPQESVTLVSGPVATTEVAPLPVQGRPKKRLRSRIGCALSTAASYVVPGTAVAMGLFMYLPESFFTE